EVAHDRILPRILHISAIVGVSDLPRALRPGVVVARMRKADGVADLMDQIHEAFFSRREFLKRGGNLVAAGIHTWIQVEPDGDRAAAARRTDVAGAGDALRGAVGVIDESNLVWVGPDDQVEADVRHIRPELQRVEGGGYFVVIELRPIVGRFEAVRDGRR